MNDRKLLSVCGVKIDNRNGEREIINASLALTIMLPHLSLMLEAPGSSEMPCVD